MEMTSNSVASPVPSVANSLLSDTPVMEVISNYVTSAHMVEAVATVAVAAALISVGALAVPQNERPVFYQSTAAGDVVLDPSGSRELVKETVSGMMLFITCVFVPLALQLGLSAGFGFPNDVHNSCCVYLMAMSLVSLITGVAKRYCGYLRPNFYEGCAFDASTLECASYDADEFRRSFPSGHAAISFCGTRLISTYLRQTFAHPSSLTRPTPAASSYLKARFLPRFAGALCASPLLFAFFVSASRVADNFHFPADVAAGALVGWACAGFAHDLWFPPNNWYQPPAI